MRHADNAKAAELPAADHDRDAHAHHKPERVEARA